MKAFLATLLGLFAVVLPVPAQAPVPVPSGSAPEATPPPAPEARHQRHRKGKHHRHPRIRPAAGGPAQAKVWPGQGEPEVERARLCILEREGGNDYQAEDPGHRWFGGYQFHLRTSNEAARRMHRPDLVGVPASEWDPEDQDAAFYVIFDRGRGRGHWSGGRFPCF